MIHNDIGFILKPIEQQRPTYEDDVLHFKSFV